jgi:ATP-binding cassette subfamily F protein 3
MMFSGDDAEKKIRVLSGGERSRVLLGKILAAPSNILFLDEPTHHLDIESCQAMMDAVRDFEGAALVVAHDEHFLNEVATKLIVFKNDKAFLYPGTYRDFLDSGGWEDDEEVKPSPAKPQSSPGAAQSISQAIPLPAPPAPAKNGPAPAPKTHKSKMSRQACLPAKSSQAVRQARAEFIAMRSKVLKSLEEKVKGLEDEIISSEARVAAVNGELAKASVRGGLGAIRRSELSRELKDLADRIDSCYAELDAAMKEYDAAKEKYSDGQ